MRTTIDLPDELYRTLKTRAAISWMTMRELIQGLIEQGLRQVQGGPTQATSHRAPPPVIIPATGVPLPDLTPEDLHRLKEEDDFEQHA